MFTDVLSTLVRWLEKVISAILVVLILLAIIGLGVHIGHMIAGHAAYLAHDDLAESIEHVLLVFVLFELFSIALAYQRGGSVVRTVLEAALVAVARKVIAFEPGEQALNKGLALASLLLALTAGWLMLMKARAVQEQTAPTPEPLTPPEQ